MDKTETMVMTHTDFLKSLEVKGIRIVGCYVDSNCSVDDSFLDIVTLPGKEQASQPTPEPAFGVHLCEAWLAIKELWRRT